MKKFNADGGHLTTDYPFLKAWTNAIAWNIDQFQPHEAKKELISADAMRSDASIPVAEHAALTILANQMLNLDEVRNKWRMFNPACGHLTTDHSSRKALTTAIAWNTDQPQPDEAKKFSADGAKKSAASIPVAEDAALTMLASQLLNLDEVRNK